MADRGVPLNGDGKGEVDGAGKADVSHGKEDWNELEEVRGLLDHGEELWQTEYKHGQDDVQQVIACKAQQQMVEVFLDPFSAEQEDCKAIANNSKAANSDLKRRKLWNDGTVQ